MHQHRSKRRRQKIDPKDAAAVEHENGIRLVSDALYAAHQRELTQHYVDIAVVNLPPATLYRGP